MPLARIITSTPSSAHEVAAALTDSGYLVEIVSPAHIPATAVDLEIDLDLRDTVKPAADSVSDSVHQDSVTSTTVPVQVGETARVIGTVRPAEAFDSFQPPAFNADAALSEDGEEYGPIEREFVLAPLWRKYTAHLRDIWTAFRPQRVRTSEERLNTHVEVHPIGLQELPQLDLEQQHCYQQVAPEPVLGPEPVRQFTEQPQQAGPEFVPVEKGPSSFEMTLANLQEKLASMREKSALRIDDANAFLSRASARLSTSASQRSAQVRDRFTRLQQAYAARSNRPTTASTARNESAPWNRADPIPLAPLPVPARKTERRGNYLVHQLWPVAAGVSMAFILGWVAATFNKLPAPQPASVTNVLAAKTVAKPIGHKKAAVRTRKPSRNVVASARRPAPGRAARNRNSEADTLANDEVIVHRYPSRTVTAQNRQQQSQAKRFSDLQ
jgi:hypothetical protein